MKSENEMELDDDKILFPETFTIILSLGHIRILRVLLNHPGGILQKKLKSKLNISKGHLSRLIKDLVKLGWVLGKTKNI